MLDGVLHYGCDNNANNRQTVSNSYYSAHNKLMAIQKWTDASHTWEEYWYDALGRRVFTRTRHDLPTCGYPIVCPGFVDRTVWDGDQIIAEQRSSGLDAITGGAPNFGTVRYVHLLGIDAPVAILDNRFSDARVIHYNWRGLAEASSSSNGNPADEELGAGIKVAWPAGQGVYLKKGSNPNVGQEVTWIGSLPANGQGDAGLVYRRNRYFDPASGRFTQEDPIGLAGGLNLYGFAGGDPVNFSDPFGLCDDPNDPKCKKGPVLAVGISGTVALAHFGINWEGGIALNLRTGDLMGFGRYGPSMGAAISLGYEGTVQTGSLDDFEGTDDINKNPVEVEAGALVGFNVVLDASERDLKPIGIGGNRGGGGGVAINLTKDTAASGTVNVYKPIKDAYRRVRDFVRSLSQ